MYRVFFNNKFNTDLGIYAVRRPNFPAFKKKYKEYDVSGVNGELFEFDGYENRHIKIDFIFKDDYDIWEKIRKIERWLNNIENNILSFSDNPSYFYIVKKVEYDDIERMYKRIGKFSITFITYPFVKNDSSQQPITLVNNAKLNNEGDHESYPIITLTGEGLINLYVNNNLVTLNLSGTIVINSELKLCYRDGVMVNSVMKGKFPVLNIGENIIKWEGNITNMSIIPNYLYY